MATVLGIDLGTQSIKTVFYDADAREITASASEAYDLIEGADGTREQMTDWWAEGLKKCLDRMDPQLKSSVAAIGVSWATTWFCSPGRQWRRTGSSQIVVRYGYV